MRKLKIIFTIIISFAILSCEKRNSSLEIEKEIINNLFVEMVDSIHKDPRIYLTFPPNPDIIYDQKGNKIGVDSTEYKIEIIKYNNDEELRKKDTSKLLFGVSEKIYRPSEYEYKSIESYFKTLKLQIDTTSNSTESKIDLEQFKNNKKFRFKYLSEFPIGANILNNDGTFKFSGGIAFSKIIFDERKQIGILCGNYLCEPRCGIGYLIIIKKINNKWKIKKIERTWQS
ncbi:hypothetical protein [Flavobacterium caseinilyticum]|uniref:Lipoprotein n=1 Tax=Flavobacterium caseinilyticum TaxID=2541732 RepID=A0A4R5ALY3_9FLAO|nr:hypothetical protein [Flavobacterium caseinilyticum]TDD73623.1 hypothetical protein E0F89_16920 [Flavobacterium caseinilyticum]